MSQAREAKEKQLTDQLFAKTERALKSAGFSRSKVAKELYKIAFSDIADYLQIDEQGSAKPLPVDQLKTGASRAIKKIREKRRLLNTKDEDNIILEDVFEFELYDKLDALKTVASMFGMERPKEVKHSGDVGVGLTGICPELREAIDRFLAGRK